MSFMIEYVESPMTFEEFKIHAGIIKSTLKTRFW